MSYFTQTRHLVLLLTAIVAIVTSACIWPGKTTYDTPEKPSGFEAGETHRTLVLKKLGNPREQTADGRLTVHDYMRTRRLNMMNLYDADAFREDQFKARFLLLVVYDENDIVKRLEEYKCESHKYKTGDPVCSSRYPLCGVLIEIDDAPLVQRYCDTTTIDYYRNRALIESLRTPLREAVERGDLARIEQLIAQGADVNRRPSLLLAALRPGYDRDVVKLLLENGADVDERSFWSYTTLYFAVKNRDTELVKMLLVHGVNVNAFGNRQVLHLAASNGDIAMAQLLIAKGADVNAKDLYGRTPLHVAAIKGRTSLAELLLANGADVNARDSRGETPLRLATRRRRKETAELLKQHGARE
jgi:hypothetical protein